MEKPKRKHVYVVRSEGNYDLLHPNKKEFCYLFFNLRDGLQRSYVVEQEIDTDDYQWCAEELQRIIDRYLYSNNKEKIAEVVRWLREVEKAQYRMILEYDISSGEYELELAQKKIDRAKSELNCLMEEIAAA